MKMQNWYTIQVNKKGGINVIDAICGAGKTTWAIQYMNDNKYTKSFIFVTPYLSEIERIKEECPNLDFKEPNTRNKNGSKLYSLKELVAKGENIATTHNLFRNLDDETLEVIKDTGYTLMLDEVMNVVNQYPISKSDMKLLLDKVCEEKEGQLKWIDDSYEGKFSDIKKMSEIGNIYYYRNKFLFWTITANSFKVFNEVFVMTYMFEGQLQKYFYDLHGIDYNMKSVMCKDGIYELVDYDAKYDYREELAKLIDIYEDAGKSKLNSNYAKRINENSLSSTNLKNMDKESQSVINKNINNFFRTYCKSKSVDCMWTTITEVAPKVKGKYNTFKQIKLEDGEKVIDKNKCNFVPCNARATNIYRNRHCLAYVYNRFMNPYEKCFFEDNGIKVNEDLLALSDLIQWIFRSALRDGEPIKLYIPSSRMRKLLKDWLEYKI